jgi:hypothetical protein
MRYFIAINLLITAGIGYVLWNANPGESCNAEGVILLQYAFPYFAAAYTLLMLFAFRRKSALLALLAGVALWFPLAVAWGCVCGHESYSWIPLPLSFLILPPLGIGYAYARKEVDFILLILYFLGLLPAIIYLA